MFAMGDTRRNAVTMDTRYGGRQRGLRRAGGLRRHCRLYVWGDGTGEWPGRFMVSSFCPLWPADHWDDPAPGAEGVGLVNQWIDADGDDQVIWAYLEREYEAMYTAFTSCLAARRTGAVAALRTRGRFDEAARIEDLGPEEFERRLLGSERKKIVMERERRLSGTGGRLLEGDRR